MKCGANWLVKARGVEENAVAEIEHYFVDLSKRIRNHEQALLDAQPIHFPVSIRFSSFFPVVRPFSRVIGRSGRLVLR